MSLLLAFQGAPPVTPDLIFVVGELLEDFDDEDLSTALLDFEAASGPLLSVPADDLDVEEESDLLSDLPFRTVPDDVLFHDAELTYLDEDGDWSDVGADGEQVSDETPFVTEMGYFIPCFRPRRGR